MNKDYKPPKFKCLRCKKMRVESGLSKPPICIHCSREIDRKSEKIEVIPSLKGEPYIARHNRVVVKAAYHPHDEVMLSKLNSTIPPIKAYLFVYTRQHGKCARCHRVSPTMRVILCAKHPKIRILVCQACYDAKPRPSNQTNPSVASTELIMWRRADVLMRTMLLSNEVFMSDLLKDPLLTGKARSAIMKWVESRMGPSNSMGEQKECQVQ